MKATKIRSMKARRAAFVKAAVSRWNRKDSVPKQCVDLLEQMRVFLKSTQRVSLLEWARLLYIKHSAKNSEVGKEYAAIDSEVSLFAFIDHWEFPDDSPLTLREVDQMAKDGLPPELIEQARELFKEKKSC